MSPSWPERFMILRRIGVALAVLAWLVLGAGQAAARHRSVAPRLPDASAGDSGRVVHRVEAGPGGIRVEGREEETTPGERRGTEVNIGPDATDRDIGRWVGQRPNARQRKNDGKEKSKSPAEKMLGDIHLCNGR